jgi:putative phosphoesterase
MKIGIMSDSHKDSFHTGLLIEHLVKEGAEYLIHAGDFELVENLQLLEKSGLPYVSVFGNNDLALVPHRKAFKIYREPHYFAINGLKFKLMHMPCYMSRDDADIIIYGHTHQVKFKYNEGLLLINPGELCARNTGRHESLMLECQDDRYIITHYFKTGDGTTIQKQTTEFLKE